MTDGVKRYDDVMCSCTEGTRTVTKAYYVLASDHDATVTALREQVAEAVSLIKEGTFTESRLKQRVDVLEREAEQAGVIFTDLTTKLAAAEGELHRQQVALDRSSDGAYLNDMLQENDRLRALVGRCRS